MGDIREGKTEERGERPAASVERKGKGGEEGGEGWRGEDRGEAKEE